VAIAIREGAIGLIISIIVFFMDLVLECTEKKCASAKHHFDHCQERIGGGNTKFKGENCVEELCRHIIFIPTHTC
jgi:hypothetical protein